MAVLTKKVSTEQIGILSAVIFELERQHGSMLIDAERLNKSIPHVNALVEIWDEVRQQTEEKNDAE